MTNHDWAQVARLVFGGGALVCYAMGLITDMRERRRIKTIFAARYPTSEPEPAPHPSHVGAYRTNPRPQPSLPRKAPWWRLAMWWARGGPRKLERRGLRRWAEENTVTPKWLAEMRRESEAERRRFASTLPEEPGAAATDPRDEVNQLRLLRCYTKWYVSAASHRGLYQAAAMYRERTVTIDSRLRRLGWDPDA